MALSKNRNTAELADAGRLVVYPVAANVKIFVGALTALDSAGRAVPASVSTDPTPTPQRVVGRCEGKARGLPTEIADNTGGAAAAFDVLIRRGVFKFKNAAGGDAIAQGDAGNLCYATDDETVSDLLKAGADTVQTRPTAGRIVSIDPDGGIWVDTAVKETLVQTQAAVADVTLAVVTGVDGTGANAASKADVDTRLGTIQTKINGMLAAMRGAKVVAP